MLGREDSHGHRPTRPYRTEWTPRRDGQQPAIWDRPVGLVCYGCG